MYGPRNKSPYGYGQMFAKFHRYKLAEQFFDRWTFNNHHIDNNSVLARHLSGTCLAMMAFPSPAELGPENNSKIGRTEFEGNVIEYDLVPEAEAIRYASVILDYERVGSVEAALQKLSTNIRTLAQKGRR